MACCAWKLEPAKRQLKFLKCQWSDQPPLFSCESLVDDLCIAVDPQILRRICVGRFGSGIALPSNSRL